MNKNLFKEKKEKLVEFIKNNPTILPKELANIFGCYEIDAKITRDNLLNNK